MDLDAEHLKHVIHEMTSPNRFDIVHGLGRLESRIYGFLSKNKGKRVEVERIAYAMYWDRLPEDWPDDPPNVIRTLALRINRKLGRKVIRGFHKIGGFTMDEEKD